MTKLHLGCGLQYLDGYINIDFPPNEHTVQSQLKADRFVDIIKLSYPDKSVDEIRLHHVFEHFSRPVALALLCRWRDWLKSGGKLRIETPDAMASFKLMTSLRISFDKKQQVMRHLFGSHEASWAFHYDGWYREKFKVILKELGYTNFKFTKNKWGVCRNIEVIAVKSDKNLNFQDYLLSVKRLLCQSTIRVNIKEKDSPPESELEMLNVWTEEWKKAYNNKVLSEYLPI